MAITPSHAGICVSDLDRSVRFYRDGLGFELGDRFELDSAAMPGLDRALEVPGPVKVTSQMLQSGGMRIELLHYPDMPPRGAPSTSRGQLGLTHLSFTVDDVASAAAHLVAHGGTVLDDTRAEVGVVLLFLADPDGNRIELMGS